MTIITIEQTQEIIAPVLGHSAWGVDSGVGSMITMEFGKEIWKSLPDGKEYKSGEWYLWIYMAEWYLQINGLPVVGSEDDRSVIEEVIKVMDGLKLINVDIKTPTLDTVFFFNNDIQLHVFPITFTNDSEHWMLYTPGSKVLHIGPGTQMGYIDSNSTIDEN